MKEKKSKKVKKNTAGIIAGSILRSVVLFFGFILKILFKAVTIFGLWLPIAYALFGLIMFWIFDFNPFLFDTLGTLYLCGAIACVIGAAIIAVRNVLIKPAKAVYQGYKHPIWEKNREEELEREREIEKQAGKLETVRRYKKEARLNPPEIADYVPAKESALGDFLLPIEDFTVRTDREKYDAGHALYPDWLPQISNKDTETVTVKSMPKAEKPEIYFSRLEPDLLIHEYSDRFELYRVAGNRTLPEGVEYK